MAENIQELPGWPIDNLYRSIWEQNDNALWRYAGNVLFVMGGLFAIAAFLDGKYEALLKWPLILPPIGYVLRRMSKAPPRFFEIFRDHSDRIVWLYMKDIRYVGSGARPPRREVMVCLADRQVINVMADWEQGEELLLRFSSLVPEAAVGFDPEYRQAFERDPASLRRPKGVWRYARPAVPA